MAGDEFGVEVLRVTWERNLQVVEKISAQLDIRSALRDQIRTRVIELLQKVQQDKTGDDVLMAIASGGLSLLINAAGATGGTTTSLEATKESAARELEFTDSEFAETESRMRQAMAALEASTDKYVSALRAQLNRRTAIDQLKVHVKQNILYYMQAIWSHEPPDQRFFRLYNLPIDWVEIDKTARARIAPLPAPGTSSGPVDVMKKMFAREFPRRTGLLVEPKFRRVEARPLVDVADLDTLLGFKGNYMIFPLKASNPLVEYMLQSYRTDDVLGVLDPDDVGNFDTDELEEMIRCVEEDDEISAEDRAALLDVLCQRLAAGRQDAETIIVPTGQIYIEALPGAHPLLEDFKLLHRALDVKKAEAELRAAELENLRRAARLVKGEREDPDVDRQIRIEGKPQVNVDTE
jgi:hypothetical protein